ncbi:Iron-sulfur cluster-binding protein [Chitinispirillum alkaliphilum]|nr:Iron-sulfur cluster-binding protein [Chitinispirillum alkaliphilum]
MEKSKVALVGCNSYEFSDVRAAVERGINFLGGVERFVSPNEKILLKPNILWGTDPEQCVVSHPVVFKAVVQLVKESGAVVSYGDSPGGIQSPLKALKKTGHHQVALEEEVELADFEHGREISYPEGVSSKRLTIANGVLESDGVISLPKLKTHGLTRMTGAVKNQYGCLPGAVKGDYHARFPDILEFSRLIVDVCGLVRPRLYVMDAVFAMEGNGPQSGDPRKMGLLLVSADPVALDAVAARLIDLKPEYISTSLPGKISGLGTYLEDEIELLGDEIDQFIVKDFKVVRKPVEPMPQSRYLKVVKNMILSKPVIIKDACTRCGRCIQVCPVDPKAVNWGKRGRKAPPVYHYKECIRCFCCHEMCPSRAIHIRKPILGKLFPFLSFLGLFASSRFMKKNNLVKNEKRSSSR